MDRGRKTKGKGVLSNKAKKRLLVEAKQRKRQPKPLSSAAKADLREKQKDTSIKKALQQRRKLSRNPIQTIEDIFANKEIPVPYGSKFWCIKEIVRQTPQNTHRLAAKRLILALESKRCKLFEASNSSEYVRAIRALSKCSAQWIRPPEEWKCRSKNASRQFRALVRHLLAKYDVPIFFDEAWYSAPSFVHENAVESAHQSWWIHIAKGGNIRKAQGLPVPLTKKMAHFMLQAPDDYSINAAIRWGQIHALGGNQRTAQGIRETFLCQGYFQNDDFWQSVFRFFINNPMLDSAQYVNIIDYLRNQKFISPPGAENPPQPNLQMKDRNPETLMEQVEAWHNRLARLNRKRSKRPGSWEHHAVVSDLSKMEGKKEDPVEYRVTQLLTADELSTEGRRLRHCVSSYAWSCANGNTSIWSVRRMQPGDQWECLGTIELNNTNKTVVQFKAKRNMKPLPKAYALMELWAKNGGLKISNWV